MDSRVPMHQVMFLRIFHVPISNEPTKSFSRLGAVERLPIAFYGLQNRNQAIFSVFCRCQLIDSGEGCQGSRFIFSQKIPRTCRKRPAKSFNRPGGVIQGPVSFYGLRNMNWTVFLIFHGICHGFGVFRGSRLIFLAKFLEDF